MSEELVAVNDILTVREAAEIYGSTIMGIYIAVARGRITPLKGPYPILLHRRDVERLRRTNPGPGRPKLNRAP